MKLTFHKLPPSHPCMTVEAALHHKGLEFETVTLQPGVHNAEMEKIYGEGKTTVPGLVADGEPVHGSVAILAKLEEIAPEPPLYPDSIAVKVSEAEEWGDRELQDLGRRLTFGTLHFRPESFGSFGGVGELDPPGTDFAMKYIRQSWRYHGITAERLAGDLRGLPEKVERIEAFAADGIVAGEAPTAADFQIGATIRVLLTVGDLDAFLIGTAGESIARRWFPDYPGRVPTGAYPASWTVSP